MAIGDTASVGPQSHSLSRPGAGRLAVCAALMQCLASAQAENVLFAKEPAAQAAWGDKTAYVPQGRQMERFKAFARQTELPPITATNALLTVGGAVNTDCTRLANLSSQEKQALAAQFRIPLAVIDKLVQRLASGSPPSAEQFSQELRTTVIDYRFLHTEWVRYHPPADGQPTKAAAMAALQSGDISQAWKLYDGLRRPQPPRMGAPAPPVNLRIVTQ